MPLFPVDANVHGSGKSLLTDVIGIIVSGLAMPRFSNPRDDAEARKRITSLALAGDPLVLIDNIGSTLGYCVGCMHSAEKSTVWKCWMARTEQFGCASIDEMLCACAPLYRERGWTVKSARERK